MTVFLHSREMHWFSKPKPKYVTSVSLLPLQIFAVLADYNILYWKTDSEDLCTFLCLYWPNQTLCSSVQHNAAYQLAESFSDLICLSRQENLLRDSTQLVSIQPWVMVWRTIASSSLNLFTEVYIKKTNRRVLRCSWYHSFFFLVLGLWSSNPPGESRSCLETSSRKQELTYSFPATCHC